VVRCSRLSRGSGPENGALIDDIEEVRVQVNARPSCGVGVVAETEHPERGGEMRKVRKMDEMLDCRRKEEEAQTSCWVECDHDAEGGAEVGAAAETERRDQGGGQHQNLTARAVIVRGGKTRTHCGEWNEHVSAATRREHENDTAAEGMAAEHAEAGGAAPENAAAERATPGETDPTRGVK
jgi:hypothetical protein